MDASFNRLRSPFRRHAILPASIDAYYTHLSWLLRWALFICYALCRTMRCTSCAYVAILRLSRDGRTLFIYDKMLCIFRFKVMLEHWRPSFTVLLFRVVKLCCSGAKSIACKAWICGEEWINKFIRRALEGNCSRNQIDCGKCAFRFSSMRKRLSRRILGVYWLPQSLVTAKPPPKDAKTRLSPQTRVIRRYGSVRRKLTKTKKHFFCTHWTSEICTQRRSGWDALLLFNASYFAVAIFTWNFLFDFIWICVCWLSTPLAICAFGSHANHRY